MHQRQAHAVLFLAGNLILLCRQTLQRRQKPPPRLQICASQQQCGPPLASMCNSIPLEGVHAAGHFSFVAPRSPLTFHMRDMGGSYTHCPFPGSSQRRVLKALMSLLSPEYTVSRHAAGYAGPAGVGKQVPQARTRCKWQHEREQQRRGGRGSGGASLGKTRISVKSG